MSLYHKNPLWASNFISILSFLSPGIYIKLARLPAWEKSEKPWFPKVSLYRSDPAKEMIEVSSSEILSPYAIDIHEYQGPTKLSTTPPPPLQIIKTHLFIPTILVECMSFTHPSTFPRHFSHHRLAPWTDWCPKHSTKPVELVDDFKGEILLGKYSLLGWTHGSDRNDR